MNIYQIVRNSKSHLFAFLLFAVVFCIAIWLRWNAFWMPHWIGDQSHYVALAVKLKTGGLENYNLREIELRTLKKPGDKEISLVYPKHSAIGKEGDILKALKIIGQGYYDEPLHMRAPLFPYALLLSHRILSTKKSTFYNRFVKLRGESQTRQARLSSGGTILGCHRAFHVQFEHHHDDILDRPDVVRYPNSILCGIPDGDKRRLRVDGASTVDRRYALVLFTDIPCPFSCLLLQKENRRGVHLGLSGRSCDLNEANRGLSLGHGLDSFRAHGRSPMVVQDSDP